MTKKLTVEERFWAKVDKTSGHGPWGNCWEWTAAVATNGYGKFRLEGRTAIAHRVAWEFTNGPIPLGDGFHGTVVRHICNNRLCCNTSHLLLGTQAENVADRDNQDRHGALTKKHLWPRGERSSVHKLSDAQVAEIRQLAGEFTQKDIGTRFGVSQQHVSRLVARRRRASETY